MATTDTDDLFTYNSDSRRESLATLRRNAPCKCMSCWGEFQITVCTVDPRNTIENMRMLAN